MQTEDEMMRERLRERKTRRERDKGERCKHCSLAEALECSCRGKKEIWGLRAFLLHWTPRSVVWKSQGVCVSVCVCV